jgi:hypothetical protein
MPEVEEIEPIVGMAATDGLQDARITNYGRVNGWFPRRLVRVAEVRQLLDD